MFGNMDDFGTVFCDADEHYYGGEEQFLYATSTYGGFDPTYDCMVDDV